MGRTRSSNKGKGSDSDVSDNEAKPEPAEQLKNSQEISDDELKKSPTKRRKKLNSIPLEENMGDIDSPKERAGISQEADREKTPPLSTNSILRSPTKSPKGPKSPIRVKFQAVEIRQYDRCHGGSAGIPTQGAYPLGLDWTYDEHVMKRTVSDFEHDKNKTSTSDGVVFVPEKDRKKIIRKL